MTRTSRRVLRLLVLLGVGVYVWRQVMEVEAALRYAHESQEWEKGSEPNGGHRYQGQE